ncbi:hypothetical protein N7452_006312 [Penicillium brevicompactum]|uniref:Histone-lysine N-methyltransferase SET5 n=1 Tax=Penicillium brevicompactum TaxID=5074 RepID=A0A9W9QN88_PENBR|nr:hypothetical protein N7452_006312 [Penicillium brevicompactum]
MSSSAAATAAPEKPDGPSYRAIRAQYAGKDIIYPAYFPKGPQLHDQIKLGDPLTKDNAFLARRLWQGPDTDLGNAWKAHTDRPYERAQDDILDMHVLAHNVYEHLMSNPFLPLSREAALANWNIEGLNVTYDGVQGLDGLRQNIFVNGLNVQTPEAWTIQTLKAELVARGLPVAGHKAQLQERLLNFELDRKIGLMSQSDLGHWGINREKTPVISPARNTALSALDMYTAAVNLSPYNPTYWTSRAYCHYMQGFFDLAIGDAYRAQLLCEVLTTALKRNQRPGLYTRVWDAIQMHLMAGCTDENIPSEVRRMRGPNGVNYFIPTLRNAIHNIISLSLVAMNCWDDFLAHMEEHRNRVLSHRDAEIPNQRQIAVMPIIEDMKSRRLKPSADNPPLYGHEWIRGCVSGEARYPYEQTDVNREAAPFIAALNRNVFTFSRDAALAARPCEVRPAVHSDGTSNGLGVFAVDNIAAGTVIYDEEPVIRGNLTPNLLDQGHNITSSVWPHCDNCGLQIPQDQVAHFTRNWEFIKNPEMDTELQHPLPCPCSSQINTVKTCIRHDGLPAPFFCAGNQLKNRGSADSCLTIATRLFAFPEFKDIEWRWLHDAMRANITTHEGQDYFESHHEKQGTVLSLLLKSVLEITLHRRQQDPNLLAHEINELLMLESGADANETWSRSWFPFTMSGNIRVPFDILSALGVDIFRDLSFDTWVLQIVLRKLHINAVPWDLERQSNHEMFTANDGLKEAPPAKAQEDMKKETNDFNFLLPSLRNLYLFPGLSLFNHTCRQSENATWGFDSTVPNRVVVYATQNIAANDEIRIPYLNLGFPGAADGTELREAVRLFGKNCSCVQCVPLAGAGAGPGPGPGPGFGFGAGGGPGAGAGGGFGAGAGPVAGAGAGFGAGIKPGVGGALGGGGDGAASDIPGGDGSAIMEISSESQDKEMGEAEERKSEDVNMEEA